VARYYNSWIENTDQIAEEDAASTVSAEASGHPHVHPHLPAANDNVTTASAQSLPTADAELSDSTHSVDNVDKYDDDDDDDDEDDSDIFRSFMWVHYVPPYLIQGHGQGHEPMKVGKSAIFNSYLLPY